MSKRRESKHRRPTNRPSGRILTLARQAWGIIGVIWPAFLVFAAIIGAWNDFPKFWSDISGSGGTWFWVLLGTIIVGLWLAAWYVSRTSHLGDRLQRLDPRIVRWGARALLVILPLVVVAVVVWWVSPPKQTVVLVADFVDPSGVDSARVTQSLVDGMSKPLQAHNRDIVVKRLNQFIEPEGGSEKARGIGNSPFHKAAFVLWGDYTLQPDPELHVHFDILRQTETYLRSGQAQDYGPAQIQQPTMFDFKARLGTYLGQLTAFASGLTLFNASKNLEAIPLFETAAQALGQPLAKDLERPIRFYRGTNYLALDRALDAKPDLQTLAPAIDEAVQSLDEIAISALGNLGVVAHALGDHVGAKAYFEQVLKLDRQLGIRLGEAADLGNLGNVARDLGDYAGAKAYHEQALKLNRQLGNRLGEAADLNNLGLVAYDLGDYAGATVCHEQALALHRQLSNRLGEAADLGNLGNVARDLGDYAGAKAYYEQALALHRQLGNRLGEANQLGNLGLVAYDLGDYAGAKAYHEQALALHRQLGHRQGEAQTLGNLGNVAYAQGDYARTKTYYEQALALHRQLGHRQGEAQTLGNLGLVARKQGDYVTAKAYYEQSAQLYQQMGLAIPSAVQSALDALSQQP
jgi:tetratricopeptide (TPR) repeat protein